MFFDIHCHILYGIDDGPDNPSGMFEMIKTAYFYGVRKIIVTPHHNPMLFKYSPETESKVFSELLDYSAVRFPDLKIYKGNEIFAYTRFPGAVAENMPVFMAGKNIALVEFLPDSDFRFVHELVITLRSMGVVPLIAHIERYGKLSGKNISEIKGLGAVISMNSSFYLKKGLFKKRKYYRLLKKNLIDIITSDAHRAEDYRIFYDCYNFLVKKSGRNKADMLFYQNACNLFETSDLHSAEPYDTK